MVFRHPDGPKEKKKSPKHPRAKRPNTGKTRPPGATGSPDKTDLRYQVREKHSCRKNKAEATGKHSSNQPRPQTPKNSPFAVKAQSRSHRDVIRALLIKTRHRCPLQRSSKRQPKGGKYIPAPPKSKKKKRSDVSRDGPNDPHPPKHKKAAIKQKTPRPQKGPGVEAMVYPNSLEVLTKKSGQVGGGREIGGQTEREGGEDGAEAYQDRGTLGRWHRSDIFFLVFFF